MAENIIASVFSLSIIEEGSIWFGTFAYRVDRVMQKVKLNRLG